MNIFKRKEMLLCIIFGIFLIIVESLGGNEQYKTLLIVKYKSILVPVFTMLFVWIREEEKEKYKAKLSNLVYVTQLQYDREFSIYIETFETLFKMIASTQNLQPIIDSIPSDVDVKKNMYIERSRDWKKNYNSFSESVIKYSPFYEKDIKEIFLKIRKICSEEHIYFEMAKLRSKEERLYFDFEASTKRKELINDKKEEVELLIRTRLDKMKVI